MKNFSKLGIDKDLNETLEKNRIVEPTRIQELTIPRILEGEDVIGKAQTGTGKTLAFLLPILQMIDKDSENPEAIIISPTRELALQITKEAEKLVEYKDLEVLSCYGGKDIEKQLSALKRGVNIIVGTPGRIIDHINRGSIVLDSIKYLVLDEADEIINMGFYDDVETIIKKTPKNRQTLLFSATMPKKVKNISRTSMKSPMRLEAQEKDIRDEKIKEIIVNTTDREKEDDLCKYIDEDNPFMGIIFCRTKDRVKKLYDNMSRRGYVVDELHGDLSQAKREQALKDFRDLKTHFLIATDIAARGLDIEGVTHVFNYDMPDREVGYIHRIGRTGRMNEDGIAVTFVTKEDKKRQERKDSYDRKKTSRKESGKKETFKRKKKIRGSKNKNRKSYK